MSTPVDCVLRSAGSVARVISRLCGARVIASQPSDEVSRVSARVINMKWSGSKLRLHAPNARQPKNPPAVGVHLRRPPRIARQPCGRTAQIPGVDRSRLSIPGWRHRGLLEFATFVLLAGSTQ